MVISMSCVYLGTFQSSKSLWYIGNMSRFLHFIEGGKEIVGRYSPKLNLVIYLALILFLFIFI